MLILILAVLCRIWSGADVGQKLPECLMYRELYDTELLVNLSRAHREGAQQSALEDYGLHLVCNLLLQNR